MKPLALAIAAIALAACAVGDAESPRPRIEAGACLASFAAVVEGWDMMIGRVPEECRHLDDAYRVIVTSSKMPCTSHEPGRVVGCHMPTNEIFIADGLSETKSTDVSVHEWTHALSMCVFGDQDGYHSNLRVWGEHPHDHAVTISPDNVRSYGIVSSAIGPCLEP